MGTSIASGRHIPRLLASIAATTHGIYNYIVRPDGLPYAKPDRLGRAFVRWATEAGVTKSGYGLRNLAPSRSPTTTPTSSRSENFLGHATFAEAEVYIRNRDKRRASQRAIALMDIEKAAKAAG